MYYSISRLSALDVRWADNLDGNQASFFQNIHHNPYYELIVVADGVVHLQAGDKAYTLEAGDTLLLTPWEQHRGWRRGERQGHFFWAQFSCTPEIASFIDDPRDDLKIVHSRPAELRTVQEALEEALIVPKRFRTRQRYKLLSLFEELTETLRKPKGHFRFHATLLLGEIVRVLANEFMEESETHAAFPQSYTTFRRLVNHLNNGYEREIGKAQLEEATGRTYEYLCQVFKKYANMTIVGYVHQLRVQQAKHLLEHTDRSVREIGESVGYSDPFYFSRMFKKIERVSPQQFRLQRRGQWPEPSS